MKRKPFILLLFLCTQFSVFAQNKANDILFTIDNTPYYTNEFLRVYNKNLDLVKDESQKDLTQYLELFVGYKLKITKANKLGLQNGEAYKNELASYRTQLSKNYLTDSKVTNELVVEGYERSKKEIKAAHILLLVDENAAPADTLVAFNKAKEIRERALKGEDFAQLAVEFSQDPSVKENKGDLGYFSSFRMVYAFESAAFKTAKGAISNPVRTRFGYHLIKVEDVRDNRGEVTVAHIMILNPKEDKSEDKAAAKTKIDDIYQKLQQGEKFEELAKQFSEDKSSSSRGGVLTRFGSGQLSAEEFENTAFGLTQQNPISTPIQTRFGWHIIKLIEKHPLKSFDEMKAELENKVGKDDRSRLITNSLNDKLQKKYMPKREAKLYAQLVKAVTDDFYESKWEVPVNKAFAAKLLTFDKKIISGDDFLGYVKDQQKAGIKTKPIAALVDQLYKQFSEEQLTKYYTDNLEQEFPEFATVMEEYRDGLLLFDLMEKEIWEKSKTDTLGLNSFYETRKFNYMWKNRLDALVISSTSADVMKKAQKLLKKGVSAEKIKETLNSKEKVLVMTNSGIFEEGTDALPKNVPFQVGITEITKEGEYYFITKVNKILPETAKTLSECKGKAINDYQQFLEQKWVDDLKAEFAVKINQDVFDAVKNQLKK